MVVLALTLPLLGGCGLFSKRLHIDGKPVTELATKAAQLPDDLDKDCANPVVVPNRALSSGETERGWGTDRTSLTKCRDLHKQTREFYKNRDKKLALTANGKQ